MSLPYRPSEQTFKGLVACNYSAIAALMFSSWDMLITLGDMIEHVWTKEWNKTTWLSILMRVFSFGSQMAAVVLTMKATTLGSVVEPSKCRLLLVFQGFASQVLTMGVQFILSLRVIALYSEWKSLKFILAGFWMVEVVMMSAILSIAGPRITFTHQCVPIVFPTMTIGFFIGPLSLDILLFSLTMKKFFLSMRGIRAPPWVTRFMQDGVWAFSLPLLIALVNIACMMFLHSAYSSIAFSWSIAIPGFAGYRLILHLRKCAPQDLAFSETGGDIEFDTIAITNGTSESADTVVMHSEYAPASPAVGP